MLCLGSEEATELVDGGAEQSCRPRSSQPQQQPKAEHPCQKNVQNQLPLQEVQQVGRPRPVAQQDCQYGWRVEKLRLDVGVQGPAAVGVGVPERQLPALKRVGDESGDGVVVVAEIPGNDEAVVEEDMTVENEHFDQQHRVGEKSGGR